MFNAFPSTGTSAWKSELLLLQLGGADIISLHDQFSQLRVWRPAADVTN